MIDNFRDVFPLYRISYMWYTCFGAVVTILVALCSVPCYGWNDPNTIDKKLLAPMIRRFFRKNDHINDETSNQSKVIDESAL